LSEGQTGSCPSETQRVEVQGWKGYSRGGVSGKRTLSPSPPQGVWEVLSPLPERFRGRVPQT